MEAEHSETIVDRAVAYVKDMLRMPPADKPPDVVANPEYTDTLEITSEDAMRLDPHAYHFNKIVERSRRSTARDIADSDSAADAHMQAADIIDHAEGSIRQALGEIQDVSRDMRDTIDDESSHKTLPSESEMEESAKQSDKR